jgi:hypothetical protein
MIARPRLDEQFEIVRRIETRLIYETDTLEKQHSSCADEEEISEECDQKDR